MEINYLKRLAKLFNMIYQQYVLGNKACCRGGNKMANVYEVARYIYDNVDGISGMKLQKLLYYCQAWSLAWDGVPLFEEEFEAWANGPVCRDVYREHRGQFKLDDNFLKDYQVHAFSDIEVETIETVLNHYGEKSPHYLSELTHKELPWKEARGNTPLGEPSKEVISKETMLEYYAGLE